MRVPSLLTPAAAAAVLLLAAPAAADPRFHGTGPQGGWYGQSQRLPTELRLEREFRQLAFDYERALRSGRLDRREADRIGRRLAEIDRLGSRYARNGFNRGERQRIERLLRETRGELHHAMRNGNWRDARWSGGWR
jgi:hypothetical protein